jgi:DNA polymerase-1
VHTLLGRGSPRPSGTDAGSAAGPDEPPENPGPSPERDRRRRAWGRFTRNFVVQGTGAEWALCWLADLRNRLWRLGCGGLDDRPHLAFFLHDEIIVHTPLARADEVEEAVRDAAASAARLLFGRFPVDFPLDLRISQTAAKD